jgi:hypothetical protein
VLTVATIPAPVDVPAAKWLERGRAAAGRPSLRFAALAAYLVTVSFTTCWVTPGVMSEVRLATDE